jgi:hypothetical protein
LAAILALAAATVYGVALWRAPGWTANMTPQGRGSGSRYPIHDELSRAVQLNSRRTG